jgi:hypothetical protein
MPRIKGTTDAQSSFLRSFAKPDGPRQWPTPAVLRRWLRKPGFLQAMRSLKKAIRYQSDFQLLIASAQAATEMERSVGNLDSDGHSSQPRQLQAMANLIKLVHLRERHAPPEPKAEYTNATILHMLKTCHRDARVSDVLSFLHKKEIRKLAADIFERNIETYRAAQRSR